MRAEFNSTAGKIIFLEGNNCKRGIKFAEDELKNPVRILTTTVGIDSKKIKRLAVRSDIPVSKDMLFKIIRKARQKQLKAPVKVNQVIIPDILNTGINIIASSSVEE